MLLVFLVSIPMPAIGVWTSLLLLQSRNTRYTTTHPCLLQLCRLYRATDIFLGHTIYVGCCTQLPMIPIIVTGIPTCVCSIILLYPLILWAFVFLCTCFKTLPYSNPGSSCTFKVSSVATAEDAWSAADASLSSYSRQQNGPTLVVSQGLVQGQVRSQKVSIQQRKCVLILHSASDRSTETLLEFVYCMTSKYIVLTQTSEL